MRLSVRKEDSGYSPLCSKAKIFLDGVEVTNRCHTADDKSGIVWLYKLNDKGKKYVISSDDPRDSIDTRRRRSVVAQEMLQGRVEIRLNA